MFSDKFNLNLVLIQFHIWLACPHMPAAENAEECGPHPYQLTPPQQAECVLLTIYYARPTCNAYKERRKNISNIWYFKTLENSRPSAAPSLVHVGPEYY